MKKTGIVLELRDGRATVMKNGGTFISVPARPDWQKGDVVTFSEKSKTLRGRGPLAAMAACFLLFISLSAAGYHVWNTPVSLVSLDVNPSIEIQLNRFDRVVSSQAYNPEAQKILDTSGIGGDSLDRALQLLFSNGLDSYLRRSPYITYSVQTDDPAEETGMIARLREATDALLSQYPQSRETAVDVYPVSEETVSTAHSHHVTAGKYVTILQLQEVQPEAQVEEYAHCGIGEIQREIERCSGGGHDGRGNGSGGSNGANADGTYDDSHSGHDRNRHHDENH